MVIKQLKTSLIVLLLFTVITGLVYPLVITGISQVIFPKQANGSVIYVDGVAVGSELIGQWFTQPEYFWPRLSATSGYPYRADYSGGSNYSVLNQGLVDNANSRLAQLSESGVQPQDVPVDLVTSSASGLDPHISVASAQVQAARVAAQRGMSITEVNQLIDSNVENAFLGFLGEPRVNVLKLNIALDAQN